MTNVPDYAQRIVSVSGDDIVLVVKMEHIFYLTGFRGTAGMLLLMRGTAFLFVDARYAEHAERNVSSVTTVRVSGQYFDAVVTFLKEHEVKDVTVDEDGVLLADYTRLTALCDEAGIRVTAGQSVIADARVLKDKYELTLMKDTLRVTEIALTKTIGFIKEGMTEKELAAEVDYRLRREGGDQSSFETIALFGARSSMPHGCPSDVKLVHGDIILIDCGMRRSGYCSDITRTFFFGKGKDFQRMSRVYDAVREAQNEGIARAATGVRGADVDRAARDVMRAHKLNDYFTHGLGHGVGIEIHERPYVSEKKGDEILPGGTVITIEPGAYIPEVGGIRIENMVIVTKSGGASINITPTDMIVL
ncbi:MAG: aminopeptidase P family protein [Spirochaetes bacterium]|nr:aminopeptidase P family protein [Spirochaetota bacterium]